MNIIQTDIPGVLIIEPRVFGDARGYFMETWQQHRYAEAGIPAHFVQDNISFSQRGILRGLHFQHPQGQGKLVYVLQGEVFDVAVDIRVGSPYFGRSVALTLSAENKRQFYIPSGFAHGFCVTSEAALFVYKCTDFYNPALEGSVRWDDPEIGIDWPIRDPVLSDKDKAARLLSEISKDQLPQFSSP
jgi:dTDP-4-dehydrorhamnose 3,5-epimerase